MPGWWALTSSKYRFRARPWDLETSPAVCTGCSNGCNVWFDHRAGKFVRINGRVNEAVNEEWTCDKGKFGHDYYNSSKRLTKPLIRKGNSFVEATWSEAYEAIAAGFDRPGSEVAGLTSGRVSNEGLHLFKKLYTGVFESKNIDHRLGEAVGSSVVSSTIQSLETAKKIVIFGADLASELPIVFLRVRKAATVNGAHLTTVTRLANESDRFADVVVRISAEGEESAARVVEHSIDSDTVVLTSHSIFATSSGRAAYSVLKAACEKAGAKFNCWTSSTNGMGAELLGLTPDQPVNTETILSEAKTGRIKALWLVDADVCTLPNATEALENAEFVVVQSVVENDAMSYASVVLPMAAPAEQDGAWTNCEGRVQRMRQIVAPPGEAKPAWRIFAELLLRLRPSTPFFNSSEILAEIAATVPAFAGCTAESIPDEGFVVVGRPEPASVGDSV